ncbi:MULTISPECIES: hypothetical protein [unclassified Labrenzia]|nr:MULTISPECIES: hypothetical protein [unclassified Labrenzia]
MFNIDDIPWVFLAREVRHRQSGRPDSVSYRHSVWLEAFSK